MEIKQKPSELFDICYRRSYDQIGQSVSYKIVHDKDRVWIWFQGSCEEIDWKRNFRFFRKPYKEMKHTFYVHSGFLQAWNEVKHTIEANINDCKEIVIVGYSHGAALACLCHEFCRFHRPDAEIKTFSFEPPRSIACLKLHKDILQRFEGLTCYRNGCDIVTHVPPVIFGFRHVGKLVKMQCKNTGPVRCHYPDKVWDSLRKLED